MTMLEYLYFGNIRPNERKTKRGSQIDRLVKLIPPMDRIVNGIYSVFLFEEKLLRINQRIAVTRSSKFEPL